MKRPSDVPPRRCDSSGATPQCSPIAARDGARERAAARSGTARRERPRRSRSRRRGARRIASTRSRSDCRRVLAVQKRKLKSIAARRGSRCRRRCRRGCSRSASWSAGNASLPSSQRVAASSASAGASEVDRILAPAADRRRGPARRARSAVPDSVPRRPFLIMSPSVSRDDGSPTTHQSMRWPRSAELVGDAAHAVDWPAPSSSLVSSSAMRAACSGCAATNSSQRDDHRGDAALHVGGAAAVQRAVAHASARTASLSTPRAGRSARRRCGRGTRAPGRRAVRRPEVVDRRRSASARSRSRRARGARRCSAWQPASSGVTDARRISCGRQLDDVGHGANNCANDLSVKPTDTSPSAVTTSGRRTSAGCSLISSVHSGSLPGVLRASGRLRRRHRASIDELLPAADRVRVVLELRRRNRILAIVDEIVRDLVPREPVARLLAGVAGVEAIQHRRHGCRARVGLLRKSTRGV